MSTCGAFWLGCGGVLRQCYCCCCCCCEAHAALRRLPPVARRGPVARRPLCIKLPLPPRASLVNGERARLPRRRLLLCSVGRHAPEPSVSKRSNASRISCFCSSVSSGLPPLPLPRPEAGAGRPGAMLCQRSREATQNQVMSRRALASQVAECTIPRLRSRQAVAKGGDRPSRPPGPQVAAASCAARGRARRHCRFLVATYSLFLVGRRARTGPLPPTPPTIEHSKGQVTAHSAVTVPTGLKAN